MTHLSIAVVLLQKVVKVVGTAVVFKVLPGPVFVLLAIAIWISEIVEGTHQKH